MKKYFKFIGVVELICFGIGTFFVLIEGIIGVGTLSYLSGGEKFITVFSWIIKLILCLVLGPALGLLFLHCSETTKEEKIVLEEKPVQHPTKEAITVSEQIDLVGDEAIASCDLDIAKNKSNLNVISLDVGDMVRFKTGKEYGDIKPGEILVIVDRYPTWYRVRRLNHLNENYRGLIENLENPYDEIAEYLSKKN